LTRFAALVDRFAGSRLFKPLVFLTCLAPLAWLGYRAYQAFAEGDALALGVEPITTLLHETGEAAITILLLSLAVTPIRRLFHINRLQRVRRMLGVWAFAYAAIHFSIYLVFDRNCYAIGACQFSEVWADIVKRKFIFAGMTAFAILLVLALTSTNGWMRRLRRNWQRLHRLVYVAAIAGVVHFIWIQKSDYEEPLKYALALGVLLGLRVWFALQKRRIRSGAASHVRELTH
jgi:sulfoxide reductase heme-binding subunit YedZ